MSEIDALTHVSFAFQILILGLLVAGYAYFIKKDMKKHGALTATATILNTISILALMVPDFLHETEEIAENILGAEPLLLLGHHLIGLVAEVLAVFIVLRWALGRFSYLSCRGKALMDVTFGAWIISLALGVVIYIMHLI
jgi:uncharacterized membrane protein YozB (DUF420 family)